ncbi:MAG TPA: hypothetical protein VFQ53_43525 [Kofleriaceae bacterium]|nr:hypothetical protein [Kofleriaceae bacterium]
MRRAELDPALSATIVSARPLHYTRDAPTDDDRPAHVRAASGLAFLGDDLLVIQDDAAFVARIRDADVEAIALPAGAGGRRRFESRLGNKLDKLDLEACLVDDNELIAFGSGSIPGVREHVVVIGDGEPRVVAMPSMYEALRRACGGVLNLEGAARVGGELWLFHRGNTGPDDPGPAVVRLPFAALRDRLNGYPVAARSWIDRYDLGSIDGVRLGFTDACAVDDRVFVVIAGEASIDAIADGVVVGSRLGVIDGERVRCAPLVDREGHPVKVEGLAFDPRSGTRRDRAWITIDPDDPDAPAPLCEVELRGPWLPSTVENR